MRTTRSLAALTTLAVTALAGCGTDGADGKIAVTVYGEDYIEDRIPDTVFSDGWSVSFEMFLVTIGGAATQAGHDTAELTVPAYKVYDLSQSSNGAGYNLATLDAPAGTYDHFGYVIKPEPTATAGNAAPGDAIALVADGKSVRVKGTATKGGDLIWFDWSFGQTITHAHCDAGATVDGNTVTMQATIHADHLFYDDLVATDPNVAFDLIAAADGADGSLPNDVVTPDELAAIDLSSQTRYQVGSFPVTNLWQFISHQLGTLGHVNGEGHCEDVLVQGG